MRRWVAARFLAEEFQREQDMRRFREQGDWADPDQELMPDEEWLEEAAQVSDAKVFAALGAERVHLPKERL